MLFSSKVRFRISFSFRLVNGCAHVFMLFSVVIVALPNKSGGTLKVYDIISGRILILCMKNTTKLYSATR